MLRIASLRPWSALAGAGCFLVPVRFSSSAPPPLQPGTYSLPRDFEFPQSVYTVTGTRGSGPGGQGVNSSSNKAELRLDVGLLTANCSEIPLEVIDRLREHAGSRLTKDDVIVVTSHEHRSLTQNTKVCFKQLQDMLYAASYTPEKNEPVAPKPLHPEKRVNHEKTAQIKRKARNDARRIPRI